MVELTEVVNRYLSLESLKQKPMKYMTDAHLSGLAEELRAKGVDCETVHKLLLGSEDSRIRIGDPEIVDFLRENDKPITLITLDSELAEYCRIDKIPCVRVQDLVIEHVLKLN